MARIHFNRPTTFTNMSANRLVRILSLFCGLLCCLFLSLLSCSLFCSGFLGGRHLFQPLLCSRLFSSHLVRVCSAATVPCRLCQPYPHLLQTHSRQLCFQLLPPNTLLSADVSSTALLSAPTLAPVFCPLSAAAPGSALVVTAFPHPVIIRDRIAVQTNACLIFLFMVNAFSQLAARKISVTMRVI